MRPGDVGGLDLAELGDVVLEDAEGGKHRLGDLWATRPIVLVFLRHFG
ncbi:MAG: hypothetical protein ACR2HY_02820 [Acidimicrobiales bacterium]